MAAGAVQAGVNFTLQLATIDPGRPGGPASPGSIVSGALSLLQYQSPPKRLTNEVQLPTLPAMTCHSVINDYMMIKNYVNLANKYFAVWQENYTSGQSVQYNNVAIVGLQGVKVSGDVATVVLDLASLANSGPKALADLVEKIAGSTSSATVMALKDIKTLFSKFSDGLSTTQAVIDANNKNPGSPPSSLEGFNKILDVLNTFFTNFNEAFKLAGTKLGQLWGKINPISSFINDLLSAYNDFLAAQKDYNTAVNAINSVGTRDLNAADLYVLAEGYARSALNDYNTDLSLCQDSDPQVSPVIPPPGAGGGSTTTVGIGGAIDPNDMTGPAGYGTQGFIQPETLPYRVDFENDPAKATAAAQVVTATLTLNPNLDPGTFQFTGFGFGQHTFTVPAGLYHYSTTIDFRPDGIDLLVPITLDENPATGLVTVEFQSLDPATMLPPDGINAGFLPVDDAKGDGEGFFTYSVQPRAGLTTGTKINAQASIVFDTNAAIATPTALNTLDVGSPTSTVAGLPASSPAQFTLNLSGKDDSGGSGIGSYAIYYSDNNGPFDLLTTTSQNSIPFTGQAGHTYGFYSIATDNVGNVQPTPSGAQARTTVIVPPVLQFSATQYAANVTAGSAQIGLTRTGDLTSAATVVVSSVGGHEVAAFQMTVTFAANASTASVTVPIQNDGTSGEADVSIPLSLSSPGAGATLGAATSATLVIHDNNPAPTPATLAFSSSQFTANVTDGSALVTLTRAGNLAAAVTVVVSSPGGPDVSAFQQAVTFAANATSATVTIPIQNDGISGEADVSIPLSLLSPGAGATLGAATSATLVIHDNNPAPTPATLAFSATQFTANITDGSALVTLTRAGNLAAAVTVVVSSPGGPDVSAFQQAVNFGPNASTATVSVPIKNDGQSGEADVSIPLSLSSPGAGATLAGTSATLVVHDNNPAPVTITSARFVSMRVVTGSGRKAKSKLETVIQLKLSGSVTGAENLGAYKLLAGKTTRVRKMSVTTFSKLLALSAVQYDPSALIVTLIPKAPLNLSNPAQLRITASSLTDANGRSLDGNHDGQPGGDLVATLTKKGITIARFKGKPRVRKLSAAAVDAVLADRL